jgi:hypothetical protein
MQDDALNCSEARRRMAGYLTGEHCPEVAAHLAACEECLEACLDAALRQPQEVRVPEHFQSWVLARMPADIRPEELEYPWPLLSAAGVIAIVGVVLWWSGEFAGFATLFTDALSQPRVLLAVVGSEAAVSLLWLWRVVMTDK